MSTFNTSGRKEDISMKLRAQNMKNAKDTTKMLEQDNRKMEERLKELKMAMNREKEERERQGGGFWQRGQTGTLSNYASEVLHEKSNKQQSASKKKKVKVLSDEPLDLPVRKGGPGTLKYIAQRGSPRVESGKESKNKGTKCGQCEDRAASLTCVQCSEHYCAGCFAAFHLKGALKRHRSIPLHATGPRQCMSPRPTPPSSSRSAAGTGSGGTSDDAFYQQADRHGPRVTSGSADSEGSGGGNSSLFDGAYSEADSAASFQQALMAWRRGDDGAAAAGDDDADRVRPAVVASPVKSPVVTVECSTSTAASAKTMPDIKFSPHSLTYAQRLMLKQHRRTELPSLGPLSARSSSSPTSDLTLVTPRSEVTLVSPRRAAVLRDEEEAFESFDGDEERVDFQSLFEAVSASHSPISRVPGSSVSVVDVTSSPKQQTDSVSAESSVYTVEEISSLQAWEADRKQRLHEPPSDSVSKSSDSPGHNAQQQRLSKSRETTRVLEKRLPKSRETTHVLDKPSVLQEQNDSSLPHSQVLSSKRTVGEVPRVEEEETVSPEAREKPPPAAAARPRSSKSRPASRAKSAKSRPASRAQSRAASRLGGEGLLTKTPSSDLKEIARRAQATSTQYQSPMEDFFLAGVKVEGLVEGPQSRPATPAQAKHLKVSNKLYAMSPRSWKPDNSVGDTVPLENLGLDPSVGTKPQSPSVLHYTYSSQMEGHAFIWNQDDSLGTPVPQEDAATPVPLASTDFQSLQDDARNPGDTQRDSADFARDTPTPSGRQRKRWQAADEARPFSAQRASLAMERQSSSVLQQQSRPSSSTGGTEPKKRQARQMPTIDRDLKGPQKTRALRGKEKSDGWMSDDGSGDQAVRTMSASRTRSWVASQNSSQWETEVHPFERESSDLEASRPGEGGTESAQTTPRPDSQVTPRARSRQQPPPASARSSKSRNSTYEESGRISRAVVMDGEDLSVYDSDLVRERTVQNRDDMETLDKLEWELASESGRLTADGKISRLSAADIDNSLSSGSRSGSRSSSARMSNDQGYDINSKLREDELSDTEMERAKSSVGIDEEEVRALR